MAAEDYLPDDLSPLDEIEEPKDYTKTCIRCGKPGLVFGKRGSKWVLEELNGRKHICKKIDLRRKMFSED